MLILRYIFTLAILQILLFSSNIELSNKSTLVDIQKRGELRVGLDPGYMPFEMKNKKGELIGFDIDIANEMAKAMGVKLVLIPTAWDGIIAGLLTDKYDIIFGGMTITQERNIKVTFSDPYIVIGQSLIVKKGLEKSYKDVNSFNKTNYKIVSKLGTTGSIAAKRLFPNAKQVTFERQEEALQEVINGRADIFIYDLPPNTIFMAQKNSKNIVHLDKPITFEPLGLAIKQGDPDFINWLNHFLNQAKNDGRYDSIYNYWFKDTKWLKEIQ